MADFIPVRTVKGRDVLLDRNIDLDSKLRTVLAQCDGKRDVAQIKARFGAILDVDAALSGLLAQGLVEQGASAPAAAPASTPTVELEVPAAAAVAPSAPVTAPAEEDPFAEWFPPSMRKGRDQAA